MPFLFLMLFVGVRCLTWRGRSSWASVVAGLATVVLAFIYSQIFYSEMLGMIYQTAQSIFPILAFLTFREDERQIFLKRLINLFSIIGLVSVVAFLLHFFVNLPYTVVKHHNAFYPLIKNYIAFVVLETNDLGWFTRFSSIYTEPGHLAMIAAILLYINGYTWRKWQNIVMTVCLLWSMSLAGYALLLVGLVLYALVNSKRVALTMTKILGSIILLVVIGISFYSPQNDDVLSVMVLSRLEMDDSKGIAGNSRNSINFGQYYDKILSGSDRWLGIGRDKSNSMFGGTGNSSYKNMVLSNGIIGTSALIALMGFYLFCYPTRKGFGLMVLMIASFIQRPYFLWAIESLPYLAALSIWFQGKLNITRVEAKKISCRK